MKYLGIDYGTKRIGIAVSDDGGTLAFPYIVLEKNIGLSVAIEEIVRKEKIDEIVVGESIGNDGEANPIQKQIAVFAEAIERKLEVPVHFEKEFFTSAEAHGRQGKESLHARQTKFTAPIDLDSRAAALILQRYLDKQKKLN